MSPHFDSKVTATPTDQLVISNILSWYVCMYVISAFVCFAEIPIQTTSGSGLYHYMYCIPMYNMHIHMHICRPSMAIYINCRQNIIDCYLDLNYKVATILLQPKFGSFQTYIHYHWHMYTITTYNKRSISVCVRSGYV